MKTVTPTQAARMIGCSPQQVCTLIRTGKLIAIKEETDCNQHGFRYFLSIQSVKAYAKKPQTKGFPRGKKRNSETRKKRDG